MYTNDKFQFTLLWVVAPTVPYFLFHHHPQAIFALLYQ